MKHLAITLLAVGVLAVFNSDSTSASDRHRRVLHRNVHRNVHHDLHHDLQYNRQVRKQVHHDAHHTPMTGYQHRTLHQDLRHDASHDRLNHQSYHRQPRYVPSYSGFSIHRGGISYQTSGFSFSFHR
ncbi:MAG: hypothetical protein ABGZ53_31540 [Fuerstiella sp.]